MKSFGSTGAGAVGDDVDRVRIDDLHLLDAPDVDRGRVRAGDHRDALDRELDVLGGEVRAVVELDALAQLELPGRRRRSASSSRRGAARPRARRPTRSSVSKTCFSASAWVPVAVKCGSIESGPPRTPMVSVCAIDRCGARHPPAARPSKPQCIRCGSAHHGSTSSFNACRPRGLIQDDLRHQLVERLCSCARERAGHRRLALHQQRHGLVDDPPSPARQVEQHAATIGWS